MRPGLHHAHFDSLFFLRANLLPWATETIKRACFSTYTLSPSPVRDCAGYVSFFPIFFLLLSPCEPRTDPSPSACELFLSDAQGFHHRHFPSQLASTIDSPAFASVSA